ncbi:MAG: aldehyde dehydrogenase family protein [Pseudorhodoplanes sp.]|nr:NAD/NADP-dependent betaine aldehyde dehydrogenase [Pseudorhodoplanes sp.]MBW7949063.1 aldehyde dehydrogenase family protein [Pseudorhodoplanes sp.]
MLEIERLSVAYGKHRALSDVALSIGRGEIVTILGANGAGKTTLLKALAGLVQPLPMARRTLDGRDLGDLSLREIVEAGLALVPEGRGIFGELTVRENLAMGAYAKRARAAEAENLDYLVSLFPRLKERFGQQVRTMSGGEQQMVAIGRALMTAPEILLLDEPSLGLAPIMCTELFTALARIRERGVGVLLVEQNAKQSLKIADRGYLIESGRIVGEGSAAVLRNDPAVQRAYLGGEIHIAPPAAAATNTSRQESVMKHVNLMIGEREPAAAGGRTYDRIDPFTGEIATRAAAASVEDAVAAADAAAAAFPEWSAKGPTERRMLLLKAADLMDARGAEFSELMTAECGAIGPWGHFNTHFAASLLREAAAMTTQVAGEVIPSDKPNSFAMAVRQPAGVCLGIAPWNAPVILGVRAIAMPLACGNTVVLKASETCPATHSLIGKIMREAGLPAGVVNVVTNAPADAAKIVETLIAHPAVRRVNFTGSTKVGRIIAGHAARHLKPVLLELGGKAPMVILDDADLDEAVKAAAFGCFANMGQICMSTERIIVDEKVADAFMEKFAAKAKSLPHGDPRGHVVLGSLVSKEAAARNKELLDDAVARGARVAVGGEFKGTVVSATVVDRVTPAMRIYTEESFGPVKPVVRVKNIEEAIRVANDTEYGLSASVFGRDVVRALAVAKRIQSGICHINAPTVHDEGQMPFGGTKASGYGRFGGKAAIDEFTELRWITIQTGPHPYPF